MTGRSIVHLGADRMQIGPHRDQPGVASIIPFPVHDRFDTATVNAAVRAVHEHGYRSAFTAAMAPRQAEPFLAAGFTLHEELYLLRRALRDPVETPGNTRRARRGDWPAVLELDALAFEDFWIFDRTALLDAIKATPRHRFHVSRTAPPVGYHVTGLGGGQGYIQRVAVHPDAQGQGWGRSLVYDGLAWLQRHGASLVHVNTQLTNDRAVRLYERCGFSLAPHNLLVLRVDLD